MKVVEIFRSIEGEGALMGFSTVFIRLFGCNMRCAWCDTTYSYEPLGKFQEISIGDIVNKVKELGGAIISVTGGEPFIHSDLAKLCEALSALKKMIKIETNGSIWREIDKLEKTVKIRLVVSPKPPLYKIDPKIADRADELKFVVDENITIEALIKEPFYSIYNRGVIPILQLESNKETSLKKALELQNALLALGVNCRVLPQLHKAFNLP
ncbi:MAG: 7-carboxy-7-deazaguanine synthase QueE [Helicobacteraceae bacterium]|jgi:organic radical activating enzyme|nr:7-carboxy-7-deazaguanine synthase QueE [Helicobacteraceae bacterium]